MNATRIDGVLHPANGAGFLLAKSLGAGGELALRAAAQAAKSSKKAARQAERAAILPEAEHYARQSAVVIDPEMQKAYSDMAKGLRDEAGGESGPVAVAGLLMKARAYRQMAATLAAPVQRAGYEDLARELEQEARVRRECGGQVRAGWAADGGGGSSRC
jgi:hypothetical protein